MAIAQRLVDNGHDFLDLKKYTLIEIGNFLRVINDSEKEKKIEKVSMMWLATHMDDKAMKKFLKKNDSIPKQEAVSDEESNYQWNKFINDVRGGKFNG